MMKSNQKEKIKDDEHIFKMWTPFKIKITEKYKFVPDNIIFKIFSTLLYILAFPIIIIFNKIFFGVKVEGKENILKVKGGKITISNHVHPMDCTMNAILNIPCKMYFPTIKSNLEIPVIRHIIRLLNAIPIPDTIKMKKEFFKCIDELLKNENTVQFYPEAALWPYCNRLREFKKGAFKISKKNNVPIIPIIYLFREPDGIYSLYKKKKCITIKILEPVSSSKEEKCEDYLNRVWNIMNREMKKFYHEDKEFVYEEELEEAIKG